MVSHHRGVGIFAFFQILSNEIYTKVLTALSTGIYITIFVTLVAFFMASVIGLLLALASLSKYLLLRQFARLYIEVVRGVPILVLLLYVAFVFAPALVLGWNHIAEFLGLEPARTRDFSLLWRANLALTIGYSAFIAEVFRAGLLSVPQGQIEASLSLGLNSWQRFRLIVFPQAIKQFCLLWAMILLPWSRIAHLFPFWGFWILLNLARLRQQAISDTLKPTMLWL